MIAINASASDRPQDPRLGLLQVASSVRKPPGTAPNSAAAATTVIESEDPAEAKMGRTASASSAGSRKTEETSSTSDSKDSCGDPTSLSIDDRVKALFAKCDRLQGN